MDFLSGDKLRCLGDRLMPRREGEKRRSGERASEGGGLVPVG